MSSFSLIEKLPSGYSVGEWRGERYRISRENFNEGRSVKVFAESLSGSDFISLNLYETQQGEQLRPCEMPAEKVLTFLREVTIKSA